MANEIAKIKNMHTPAAYIYAVSISNKNIAFGLNILSEVKNAKH